MHVTQEEKKRKRHFKGTRYIVTKKKGTHYTIVFLLYYYIYSGKIFKHSFFINVKITIFHVNEEKRIKETFIFVFIASLVLTKYMKWQLM